MGYITDYVIECVLVNRGQVYRNIASADRCDDVPDVDSLFSTYFHVRYQYKDIISMLA